MSTSTLVAHSPKFNSKLVTLEHLRTLPEPKSLGNRHKPVAHAHLVDTLLAEIERRDMVPMRQQLALGAKGQALFGVIDLVPREPSIGLVNGLVAEIKAERGTSFGFRSSTNESMAIKGVAGQRVFVCDNLAMSGDLIAFMRKSTTGMNLAEVVASGFDLFVEHTYMLNMQIEIMALTKISDGEAKQQIFDIFNAGIVPVRLFEDVARFYFKPSEEMTDCTPRTKFGLHNAFTRAMRDLTPVRSFNATVALGRAFDLTDGELTADDAIDLNEE